MSAKSLPISPEKLRDIIREYPTPFHIYDEKAIRENARELNKAFSWNPGFKEFFAVKALPNPHILKILHEEGFGADCSSMAELILTERAGLRGEEICFTSNNTPADEYRKALGLGALINLDDISHIPYLEKNAQMPPVCCFRYNPGSLKEGNAIIGKPEEAKYGFTREQLYEGYAFCRDKGVKRFGLHTMVASNELNPDYFIETAELLFALADDIHKKCDISFEFINLGGGFGIPYRPEQKAIDMNYVSSGIYKRYKHYFADSNTPQSLNASRKIPQSPKIFLESGRMITGPYGWLVTAVIHTKDIYKKYIGVDACMADLMRPGMYGAYHHITAPGKEQLPADHVYDVTGSLCENNDKFAINRALPVLVPGDIIVIHDTGAHGHAMGFNYNGKLRPAELLLKTDGSVKLIRRRETLADHFATLEI